MSSITDLLSKGEALISAAEKKSPALLDKATEYLMEFADFLQTIKSGIPTEAADHSSEANDLLVRCYACCPECDPRKPKGFGLPGNPILTLLFQFLSQFLQTIVVTPATPTPKT